MFKKSINPYLFREMCESLQYLKDLNVNFTIYDDRIYEIVARYWKTIKLFKNCVKEVNVTRNTFCPNFSLVGDCINQNEIKLEMEIDASVGGSLPFGPLELNLLDNNGKELESNVSEKRLHEFNII